MESHAYELLGVHAIYVDAQFVRLLDIHMKCLEAHVYQMDGHVYMLDAHTFNVDSHVLLVGFHVCTWTSTHIFGCP